MTEVTEAVETGKEIRTWRSFPELKDSKLDKLIADLDELTILKRDLEVRIAAVRTLLAPLVTAFGATIAGAVTFTRTTEEGEEICGTRRIDYTPEKTGLPGDFEEARMVQAGLSLEEINSFRGKPKKRAASFRMTILEAPPEALLPETPTSPEPETGSEPERPESAS